MTNNQQQDQGQQAGAGKDSRAEEGKGLLRCVYNRIGEDNLTIVAAGVAFFGLLSIFPALAAMVSIYGLVADPAQVTQQVQSLSEVVPAEAMKIITQQTTEIASSAGGALTIGLIGSLLLTLWAAARAIKSLITALNIAYDVEDTRGFFKVQIIGFLMTIAAIVFVLVVFAILVAVPIVLEFLRLPGPVKIAAQILRWVLLAVFGILGVNLLYRFAPNRKDATWRWLNPGAITALLLWIALSVAFSLYVRYFGSYNKTYGSLGAVVILLLWFQISALVLLLGAEINAALIARCPEGESP